MSGRALRARQRSAIRQRWTRAGHCLVAIVCCACATPPRPTPAALALAANARAVVEGRVVERDGRAVAGIHVQALPRGENIEWSPPVVTDPEGRFRLSLIAPAEYGFLLQWKARTVVTLEKDDPARLHIAVNPGENRAGIQLLFLREEWEKLP